MSKAFDIRRIINHIKRDVVLAKNTIGTTLLVSAGLLFMLCVFAQLWDKKLDSEEFMGAFGFIYFISGSLLSFSFFREAHNTKANQLYFTLPISPFERITAVWLTTAVLYTAVFSVMGLLVGGMSIFFGSLVLGADFAMSTLFSVGYWQAVAIYMTIQPVFLFGAITFKNNRIGKTLLFIIFTVLVFVLFNMVAYGLLNYGYDVFNGGPLRNQAMEKTESDLSVLGKGLFAIISGPIMLIVTYFKLVEREA
ncbi:hypothetical protein [uncultured Croceitalea sp.]|uniref:hypothetical protein n=1 Tax=uncultured Croceitalea sp. TaxID=1798908 RepID=UPI003305E80A